MPEPNGLALAEAEAILEDVQERSTLVGAGLTGLAPDPANVERLQRLTRALGL